MSHLRRTRILAVRCIPEVHGELSVASAWQGNTTQRQAEITAAVTEETNKRNATTAESNARLAVKTAEQDALQKKARIDADIAVQQRQVDPSWGAHSIWGCMQR